MRVGSLLGTLGLAAAFCVVLVLEVWPSDPTDPAGPAHAPAAREPTVPQALAAPVQDWVDDSLARPLFTQGRRPNSHGVAVAGLQGLPRLAGVIVAPSGRSAIFADGGVTTPIVAAEGTQLGRYRVQSIEAGQVTVLGPEGTRVLHPSFLGIGAQPPAPPPRPQQPRERKQ
jgi:hypothetical protein